jgi:hypothetical protein
VLKGGHCVVLYDQIIDSSAWKQLSGTAIKVYVQLVRMRYKKIEKAGKKKYCTDDNARNLVLTQNMAVELWNMDRRTLTKAVRELIEFGFIDLVQHGFIRLENSAAANKQPNVYGLTERWKDFGTPKYIPGEYMESPTKRRNKRST